MARHRPEQSEGSMDGQKPEERNKSDKQRIVGLLMLEAGAEFAFLIAVPLIAGILAGKWLDAKYSRHFFVIIGIFAGLTITCFSIYKRIGELKKMLK